MVGHAIHAHEEEQERYYSRLRAERYKKATAPGTLFLSLVVKAGIWEIRSYHEDFTSIFRWFAGQRDGEDNAILSIAQIDSVTISCHAFGGHDG